MFPLKTDYRPGGPLAQIPASDLNTLGAILNTIQIDLGTIEKTPCPTDAAPWKIKIREAVTALIGKVVEAGEAISITLPGRVQYRTESGTPRLVQHHTVVTLAADGTLSAEEDDSTEPTLITEFTPHSEEY